METNACVIFIACGIGIVVCRIIFFTKCKPAGKVRKLERPLTLEDKTGIAIIVVARTCCGIAEEAILDADAHVSWLFGYATWIIVLVISLILMACWRKRQDTPHRCKLLMRFGVTDALALAFIFDLTTQTYGMFFYTDIPHRRDQQVPFHVAHITMSMMGLYSMSLRTLSWQLIPIERHELETWPKLFQAMVPGFMRLVASPVLVMLGLWPISAGWGRSPAANTESNEEDAHIRVRAGRMFLTEWAEFAILFMALSNYQPQQTDTFDMRYVFFGLICSQLATWFIPLLFCATNSDASLGEDDTKANTVFKISWASDLVTDLPEIVIALLLSLNESSALAVNAYVSVTIVVKTALLTRMVIYHPVRQGFSVLGALLYKKGERYKVQLGSREVPWKVPPASSQWIESGISGLFTALAVFSGKSILRLTNFHSVVELRVEGVTSSNFFANVQNLVMGGLLFALSWFLLGLYRHVQTERDAVLSRSGCWCGTLAWVLLLLLFAVNLIITVVLDKSELGGALGVSSAILGLFSVTLPCLVGVALPARTDDEGNEFDHNELENDEFDLINCKGCAESIKDVGNDVLNLLIWSPAGMVVVVLKDNWNNLKSLALRLVNLAALHSSLQWIDLTVLAFYTKEKDSGEWTQLDGGEHQLLVCCLSLKLLTWVVPLGVRALAMLRKDEHDFADEEEIARPQIVHYSQISNLTMLLRSYLALYFQDAWMFWWTLFMWMTTPIHAEDILRNEPPESTPDESRVSEPAVDKTKAWRWGFLGIRCLGWWAQVVMLGLELADEEVPWSRYLTASVILTNAVFIRVDFFILLRVVSIENCWHFWQHLPQVSAIVTTVTLTIDLLTHTWIAYVGDSVGQSHLHLAHWIIAICSITAVILPQLLRFCLSLYEPQKKIIGSCSTTAMHSLIELADVVLFILLMKNIAESDAETNKYAYLSWTWLPDIRLILFILLTLQMMVWILPITYFAFQPQVAADKNAPDNFMKHVLRVSMWAEWLTDFPELVTLVLWGGWRGNDNQVFIIANLFIDTVLTFKSAIYNPISHDLCCSGGIEETQDIPGGTEDATPADTGDTTSAMEKPQDIVERI